MKVHRPCSVAGAGALIAVLAGCVAPGPYVCGTAADCTLAGVAGVCVAGSAGGATYCAYADDGCASGQRFGDAAGELAGTCAGAALLGGGECLVGAPLDPAASSCVATVCADQPWCCAASWGPACVQAAEVACGASCSGRIAFARVRLTNADHSQILEDGALEVWDVTAGAPLVATAVPTGIAGPQAYHGVHWVDLERDGVAELMVNTFDGYVGGEQQRVWQPAAPAWTVAHDLAALGAPANVIGAAFADHDQDGRLDLTLAGGSALVALRGVATGDRFTLGTPPPDFPETDPLTACVAAGDLDGDADDDLVYLDYRNDLGRVVRAGGGGFTLEPTFATASVVRGVRLGDVDGDRDLDLLVQDGAGALLLTNDGSGGLTPGWTWPAPRGDSTYSAAIWIDIDGDRDLDVAVATDNVGSLVVLENQDGVLATAPLWQAPAAQISDVEALAAGDVDGDGRLDLVVAGGDDAPSQIWLNDGDRTFSLGWSDSGVRRHVGVALGPQP